MSTRNSINKKASQLKNYVKNNNPKTLLGKINGFQKMIDRMSISIERKVELKNEDSLVSIKNIMNIKTEVVGQEPTKIASINKNSNGRGI